MVKMNTDFKHIVEDILSHPTFKELNKMKHHGDCNTTYQHSIKTAYFAYKFCNLCSMKRTDVINITRATLLHDFYDSDWRYQKHRPFFQKHAFKHGEVAEQNASLLFELDENQKDAIKHHMFPLTKWPSHKEGWVVTFADKVISTKEMCEACIYFFSTPRHKETMITNSNKTKIN